MRDHAEKQRTHHRLWACIRGADMSHQRQMEWRQKRPPEEWRAYQRLGVAVISSAVQDLKKLTRPGKESGRAGESARAFLTVSNANLKFWCGVADFDMNAILRKYWPDAGHPERVPGIVNLSESDQKKAHSGTPCEHEILRTKPFD
jgi:hypothetical protein